MQGMEPLTFFSNSAFSILAFLHGGVGSVCTHRVQYTNTQHTQCQHACMLKCTYRCVSYHMELQHQVLVDLLQCIGQSSIVVDDDAGRPWEETRMWSVLHTGFLRI